MFKFFYILFQFMAVFNNRRIKNENAFTIMGAIIAAGIMGALSILFMEMMQNQQSSTILMETKLLELTMYREIESYLSDKEACENTFKFKGNSTSPQIQRIKPHSTVLDKEVDTIRDSNNKRVYYKTPLYFNNSLKIKKMMVEPKSNLLDQANSKGGIDFVITLKRNKVSSSSAFSEKIYKIPIYVELNNNKEIDSCKVKSSFPKCSSGEVLTADNSGNLICTYGVNLADADCPTGNVIQGFSADGTKICVPIVELNDADCPHGETLKGFDPRGKRICTASSGGSKGCQGKILPTSDSSYSGPGGYSLGSLYGKTGCILNNTANGLVSGSCPSISYKPCRRAHGACIEPTRQARPAKGSCEYRCDNGVWRKRTNNCHRLP